MRKIFGVSFVVCFLALAPTAFAVGFGFIDIPDKDVPAIDIASNFSGDLSEIGGQILFKISNNGPTASFIRQIFWEFDDNLLTSGAFSSANSTGIATVGGVNFVWDTPINNPPQGNAISFIADLEAIANKGGSGKQGVDVGETAAFLFNGDFSSALASLNDGSLRIALHVQGISPTGGSDSYVNGPAAPVPEPTTMLLLATGLVCMAGFGRKKFFKK